MGYFIDMPPASKKRPPAPVKAALKFHFPKSNKALAFTKEIQKDIFLQMVSQIFLASPGIHRGSLFAGGGLPGSIHT